jgi:spore coat protein A
VTWVNDLRDTSQPGAPLRTSHYFPVDLCPHGAVENADARTVVHLHGGHVSAASDGYPEDTFPPGQEVTYDYPNSQLPATLWYHDHALGITRLDVQMGLAGFYLLRDAFEQGLNLPAGPHEIPLAIQDRTFRPDGSLQYPEMWMEHVFGDTILVNGKAWPYLDVARGKYRFRLLNGSGSRTYRLSLSSGAPFSVIGMEGGLLPAPAPVSEVTLGPGERADVVVDFAPYPAGTEILLLNSAPAPFPGQAGVGVIPNVMMFHVTSATGDTDPLPATLRPLTPLSPAAASVTREFHLEKGPADACSPFRWRITSVVNGSVAGEMWDHVSEFPELGATEIWSFANKSGVTHPIHLHLVMFQVLDRQAFEIVGGQIVPLGSPVPPPPHEAGWKDTVQVGPNEIVRLTTTATASRTIPPTRAASGPPPRPRTRSATTTSTTTATAGSTGTAAPAAACRTSSAPGLREPGEGWRRLRSRLRARPRPARAARAAAPGRRPYRAGKGSRRAMVASRPGPTLIRSTGTSTSASTRST